MKKFLLLFFLLNSVYASIGQTVQLINDINPGSSGSDPSRLLNLNGTLYFNANNGVNGYELWKSDGTVAGTAIVKDIHPGNVGSYPSNLVNVNGTLYFTAYRANGNDADIWKSDGTEAGTVLVKEFYPPTGYSRPEYLVNMNGILYFTAEDATGGRELWKSDGTADGTVMVKDINPGNASSSYVNLVIVNNTLYFAADNGVNGYELWKSDGTAAGTVLVRDISPNGSSYPSELTNVNGTLYFRADNGVNGEELWKSDGTGIGTVMVRDINPNGSSYPSRLVHVNDTLYFSANNGTNGIELWKSDGTVAGTVLVRDINPASSSSPSALTNVNGTLYFSADNGANGDYSYELWKSDGTAAGTVMVKDINPGSGADLENLFNLNGTLYFSANNGVNGRELWKSDGSANGTVMVADIEPGAGSSNPQGFAASDGRLFFRATTATTGAELWAIVLAPEINIQGNGVSIADGDNTPSAADHTDFGSQNISSGNITRTYTIENSGSAELTISLVTLSGAQAGDFSLPAAVTNVTIAAGSNTTFDVVFDPSAVGVRQATITINSNDTDEAGYDFAITGTGVSGCVEGLVKQHFSDALFFVNDSSRYVQWQWYKNNVPVSGATAPYYSEATALNGTYYVVATDREGNTQSSCPLELTGNISERKMEISPNPVSAGASVAVTLNYTTDQLQGARLVVITTTGSTMYEQANLQPVMQVQMPSTGGLYVVALLLSNGYKETVNVLVK